MTSTWALDEESATAAIEVAWFLAGDELDRIHGGADGGPGQTASAPAAGEASSDLPNDSGSTVSSRSGRTKRRQPHRRRSS